VVIKAADRNLDELCINSIRFLAVDAVEQAKAGHPGAPMGAAAMAYVLWDRFLRHNPQDPRWPDRDRFILSPGHASALLYSLLHLTGYDLPLDELKRFRQWRSKTPGHPEYGLTQGVETTTGPLGQGFANGVGMAIAERRLSADYNRPGHQVVDHFTYAIVSDGDMEEGVSSEAASLAGTLKLGKLIYLYDDNKISIEGDTSIAFTEDVGARFSGYGWHVQGPIDGFDTEEIDKAVRQAQDETGRPSLIICRTIIGYGSPNKAGTGGVHGEPLGPEETILAKAQLGWPYQELFAIPDAALEHFRKAGERGSRQQQMWESRLDAYRAAYPGEARQLEADLRGELPPGWDQGLDALFANDEKPISTRDASNRVMNFIADRVHGLMGGSADLAPSTRTLLKGKGDFGPDDHHGRNMHFGVREHAMGSIANGLAIHGGAIPYTATFLIFSDYMRPAMRLAALMEQRVVFIFTHDSIGVGEDGPTHQPIEQLMGLRTVPNLVLVRPADATETAEAWRAALERTNGPTVLVMTRQNLPLLNRNALAAARGALRGGYVLWESSDRPEVIIIGTGSEVHIALEAGQQLAERRISVRVVSMPSWELFDQQTQEYRDQVLPPGVRARVAVEAGTTVGWERYVGLDGAAIGIDHFGASAPATVLFEQFGFTAAHVLEEALRLLGKGA
jgi:transketolase